ncbi:uncharacterized protein [Ptychodera flava]|uniref:uncharacterized protein isoform X2 n=1 Tax=Ptychodera flava TaxID=63121 RepID=UPI003969D99A
MRIVQVYVVFLALWCQDSYVFTVPVTGPSSLAASTLDSADIRTSPRPSNNETSDEGYTSADVDAENKRLDHTKLGPHFSHRDTHSMGVDDLLKTWVSLARGGICDETDVIEPPKVTEIRSQVRNYQALVRVQREDNVVNYFVVYNGYDDKYHFALRSGIRPNIPLKGVPKDRVVLVEIFALRRCMGHVFWSSPVNLEITVSSDNLVTVVTPPEPAPKLCEVARADMALEGKMSENSLTVSMKPEPDIDRYLITMDTKTTRQQTYIGNGSRGSGISGMVIGDLAPAYLYKVTIIGETLCEGKAHHGAPIFFSSRTIGTRETNGGQEILSPDDCELTIY